MRALVSFVPRSAQRFALLSGLLCAPFAAAQADADRPNVLWLVAEDLSPKLCCYGTVDAHTDNLDALAARGVAYDRAFATSGVCAPARSALITGVYPSSIGSHFMRCRGRLPEGMRFFTEYLREAGYYCANRAKTDYNLPMRADAWDESSGKAHYRNRAAGQPFFQVVNFNVTHESKIRAADAQFAKLTATLTDSDRHDPAAVEVPPYYPDTAVVRRDLARHLDLQTALDEQVGRWLEELEREGLADDTIVFFYADHGDGLPRKKRWILDSGTRVPLIVVFPDRFAHLAPGVPGSRTDRLVSFVDFGPTVLSLAGVKPPAHVHGRPFLGRHEAPPRRYVYAIRDRMDERYDMVRGLRDARWHYIRHYMPHLPYQQRLDYMEKMPTMRELRRLWAAGRLPAASAAFMAERKPIEELYDTEADPHEVHNLAGSEPHRLVLERMRQEHLAWAKRTGDLGVVPEHELRARTRDRTAWEWARGQDGFSDREPPRECTVALMEYQAAARRAFRASFTELRTMLAHRDAIVRYWGIVALAATPGLAREREPHPDEVDDVLADAEAKAGVDLLRAALADESPDVRIAAAEGIARFEAPERGLGVLAAELDADSEWRRLAASNALDRLGDAARPVRDAIEAARTRPRQNNYVVRVLDALAARLRD